MNNCLNFEPQKLFIGLMDFFSILMPCAVLTYFVPNLQQTCGPIRQSFEAALRRVVELGHQRGVRTPWAKTVGTCNQLLSVADGLWTFLTIKGIEPTNNAAECALRQSVIQRKISPGDQSRQGAI